MKKFLLILFLFAMATGHSQYVRQNLVWTLDDEAPTWENYPTFVYPDTNSFHRIYQTTTQAFFGSHSIRFEVKSTDTLTSAESNFRAEVSPGTFGGRGGTLWPNDSTHWEGWFGFATMSDTANVSNDSEDEIHWQLHSSPDVNIGETGGISPPISLNKLNGRYYLHLIWDSKRNSCPGGACTFDGSASLDLGPCVNGVWDKWVIHVHFDSQNAGFGLVQVWRNDRQLVNRSGPVGYNDAQSPYFKTGTYKWPWGQYPGSTYATYGPHPANDIVYYLDEVRIGNASATYNDVVPTPTHIYKTDGEFK